MTTKNRPGRPRLADNTCSLRVVVPVDSKAAWETAAASRGQKLSEWIRSVLDRSARSTPASAPAHTPDT